MSKKKKTLKLSELLYQKKKKDYCSCPVNFTHCQWIKISMLK